MYSIKWVFNLNVGHTRSKCTVFLNNAHIYEVVVISISFSAVNILLYRFIHSIKINLNEKEENNNNKDIRKYILDSLKRNLFSTFKKKSIKNTFRKLPSWNKDANNFNKQKKKIEFPLALVLAVLVYCLTINIVKFV